MFTFSLAAVHGCAFPNSMIEEEENSISESSSSRGRYVREVTLQERSNCGPEDDQPAIRVNTTARVRALREQMSHMGLNAYIIPTDDEHQTVAGLESTT
ncbi:hypothetical protein SK128_025423 [Halocaridina rubra]|uniref:Uncharacterized protein n=1 Tax=Halocaridina rubra TaxID=373956 RepID=A0AAN8WLA4_HALRR